MLHGYGDICKERKKLKPKPSEILFEYDDIDEKSNYRDANFITNFSNVIVDGLLETEGEENLGEYQTGGGIINNSSSGAPAPILIQGFAKESDCGNDPDRKSESKSQPEERNILSKSYVVSCPPNGLLIGRKYQEGFNNPNTTYNPQTLCNITSQISPKSSCYSSLEGTSLESAASTVSFVTQFEIKPELGSECQSDELEFLQLQNELSNLKMEESMEESSEGVKGESINNPPKDEVTEPVESEKGDKGDDGGDVMKQPDDDGDDDEENEEGGAVTPTAENDQFPMSEKESYPTTPIEEQNEGEKGDNESESTMSESCESEAIVDDIELILMPEMCGTLPPTNLSPKLVRVTELKVNMDEDVFVEDEDEQSSRHVFHSIVDEDEEHDVSQNPQEEQNLSRLSVGDDEVSSCSELLEGDGQVKGASFADGESSKRSSSSSSSRRRRSTSGRISSGVQTEITAMEEPSVLSGHHGFRKKTTGKSSSARLGVPGGGGNGKKLNWKSEINLLPSKMKVKQSGFNSFESNDERDQYSPRVAKFTSQDTLNLSSQFLKPSTLYRTRNLSRNLNQFASSESTFMLPMSSEQQLSAESPRFRDRVSSSTSGGAAGNFKGVTSSHLYSASAYQISSILSGGAGASTYTKRQPISTTSGYPGGSTLRHFRSSMPDLNAVNKSYPTGAATMADTHRRRPPSKSKKHNISSSGFRLQKRSSSDEETSSLIDESERCLRSSIDLLLTDELPSPGRDSCFRSGFGSSSLAAISPGFYSSRRYCSQPNLNDQAYPPDMKDPSMGSPFLPRKLRDMRCSRWAKVILPNGHVAVVSVKETDEIQDTLTVHSEAGIIVLPFRKVIFAWKSRR